MSADDVETKSRKRGRTGNRAASDQPETREDQKIATVDAVPLGPPFRVHDGRESASGSSGNLAAFVTTFTACVSTRRSALALVPFMTLPLYDTETRSAWTPPEIVPTKAPPPSSPPHPTGTTTPTPTPTPAMPSKSHPSASLVPVWYRWRRLATVTLSPSLLGLLQTWTAWEARLVWTRAVPTDIQRWKFATGEGGGAAPRIATCKRDLRRVTFEARRQAPVFWINTALCSDLHLFDGRAIMPAGTVNCYTCMPTACHRCSTPEALGSTANAAAATTAPDECGQARADLPYAGSVDAVGWRLRGLDGTPASDNSRALDTFIDARALVMLHRVVETWTLALPNRHAPTLTQIACVVVEFACTDVDVADRS